MKVQWIQDDCTIFLDEDVRFIDFTPDILKARKIVLDFSNIDNIGSSTIAAVVFLKRDYDSDVILQNLNAHVLNVFERIGISKFFIIK